MGTANVISEQESTGARVPMRHVLLADDHLHMAKSMRMVLEHWRLRVTVVHDGREALATARAERPDVVLLDIKLPGLDGWQVAREVRATPELAGVLLLAMSGYADDQSRARSLAAGFNRHLTKPLDLGVLRALLVPAAPPPASPSPSPSPSPS